MSKNWREKIWSWICNALAVQGLVGVLRSVGVTSTVTGVLLAFWDWLGAQVFGIQVLLGTGVFLSVLSGVGAGTKRVRDYRTKKRARLSPKTSMEQTTPVIEQSEAHVTVEVEEFTRDRASIQALKVTNNTESRRRFRAHVEVLYGTEREMLGVALKDYHLPWEGRESDRALAPDETASAFVGRLDRKLQQVYETHQGDTSAVLNDTSLSSEDDRSIRFRITILAEPELPGGPVSKEYILTSGELRERGHNEPGPRGGLYPRLK